MADAEDALPLSWENIYTTGYGVRSAVLSPDGKWVAVTAGTAAGVGIYRVEVTAGGEPEAWVEGSSPSWSPDGGRIVYRNGRDLWTVRAGSRAGSRVTNDTEDGRAPVFSPDGRTVAFYSARSGSQDIWLVSAQGAIEQYLASKGYLVLAINYRGGSGFGREFQDLSVNDWANGQARDAAAAARFLRSLPFSNGKVGIYGYSYGGITTMAAIARVPEAFDAAVPMAGIYDFGDAYQNADRLGRIFIKTGHGGAPEERPETYDVSNTLARLGDIETPLLVMHGEKDVRAPYRQSSWR